MNRYLLGILLFGFSWIYPIEFKPLSVHSTILYKLVDDYVSTHSTEGSHNVYLYVNSESTKAVFSDAAKSGYTRSQVVFATYQYTFEASPRKDVMIDGFHELVAGNSVMDDAVFYTTWTSLAFNGLSLIIMARFFWTYLRSDRKILNHYKNNAHRYQTGNGINTNTSSIATNNSNTPLVVPEPFF